MSTRQRFNKWVSVPEQNRIPPSTQAEQELGLIEAALGEWDIKYPGPDKMIREDYVEKLELKRDGTYSWKPPPAWSPGTGEWGIIKTEDGFLKLCFKDTHGRWRWGFLVLMKVGKVGPIFLNWQRTYGHAVIFADRIWRADRRRSN